MHVDESPSATERFSQHISTEPTSAPIHYHIYTRTNAAAAAAAADSVLCTPLRLRQYCLNMLLLLRSIGVHLWSASVAIVCLVCILSWRPMRAATASFFLQCLVR